MRPAPNLTTGLGSKIRLETGLFRIRNGELTYINGWKDVENYTDRVEKDARKDDQDGDAYLLLDEVTGKVIRSFAFQGPVVQKVVVDF
jgi:hypothetical protein